MLTPRLGQKRGDLVGVCIVVLRRAVSDEAIAAVAQCLAVGQHIGQTKLAANGSRNVCRKFALVNELDDSWAAQSEDLGGLLRRDLLVAGQDADRLTVTQRLDDLLEDGVKLHGELDTIVITRAAKEEGSLRRGSVARLVRLDEAENRGQLVSVGGDRRDDLCGGGADGFLLLGSSIHKR